MLLAIDIGNSNVVLGVFDKERLVENWRVGTKTQITPDEYAMVFRTSSISRASISAGSTASSSPPWCRPLLPVMAEMSRKYFRMEPWS